MEFVGKIDLELGEVELKLRFANRGTQDNAGRLAHTRQLAKEIDAFAHAFAIVSMPAELTALAEALRVQADAMRARGYPERAT